MKGTAEIFEELDKKVAVEDARREVLRTRRDEIEKALRKPITSLGKLHTDRDTSTAINAAKADLQAIGKAFLDLEGELEDTLQYYKYSDIWWPAVHKTVRLCCLIRFIEDDVLIDADEVREMIGADKMRLPLEEYLIGVCSMFEEITRLCMNRVTLGDYVLPKRCADFAARVFEAFKTLNLRNDFLRRKYDGIKYAVKQIEEVIYDLTIRGLISVDESGNKKRKIQEAAMS